MACATCQTALGRAVVRCGLCRTERFCSRACVDAGHLPQCAGLRALVPRDSRSEWPMLRAGTTVFQSRVAPSREADVGPWQFRSAYVALNLAHPCSVLVQNLVQNRQRTGTPGILEYEVLRDLPLAGRNPWAVPAEPSPYDELIVAGLTRLSVDEVRARLKVARFFEVKGAVLRASTLLEWVQPNDGYAPGGRVRAGAEAPFEDSALVAPGVLVPVDHDGRFESDYLHMRQFWQKRGAFGLAAMTLWAGVLGAPRLSHNAGRTIRRVAATVYRDGGGAFALAPPVVYRDGGRPPRTTMPDCVAVMLALVQEAPAPVRMEVLGVAVQPGDTEDTCWRLMDAHLAQLAAELPPTATVWLPAALRDTGHLPMTGHFVR